MNPKFLKTVTEKRNHCWAENDIHSDFKKVQTQFIVFQLQYDPGDTFLYVRSHCLRIKM